MLSFPAQQNWTRNGMKRIIYTLLSLLILTSPALAIELQGGVAYTVDSAREYVQDGQADNLSNVNASGSEYFDEDKNTVQKKVYSYNNNGDVVGTTVQYKNEPTKAYIYGRNNNLIAIDKYDRPVDIYPHRGYRYNLEGKLTLTSLTVSKNEMFRFTPDGELIAHAINGVIYDENGNVIGTAK